MAGFCDIVCAGYSEEIPSDAVTCCMEIDKLCPDIVEHIEMVDSNIHDKELREKNSSIAQKFARFPYACIWFLDPVTMETILPREKWLPFSCSVSVWLTIANIVPQLIPVFLTGSVSKRVACHLRNNRDFECAKDFFRKFDDDIYKYRCLVRKEEYWLVFDNQKRHFSGYASGQVLPLDGGGQIEFLSPCTLIPIKDTVLWDDKQSQVTVLTPPHDSAPSLTPIPGYLEPYFLQ